MDLVQFLTILAALGTLVLFFYLLSLYDNKRLDKNEEARRRQNSKQFTADPRKIYGCDWDSNLPRPRICPMCGISLKQDEFLYASISQEANSQGKKQAKIYGCKYCYLGNSSSDASKIKESPELDI